MEKASEVTCLVSVSAHKKQYHNGHCRIAKYNFINALAGQAIKIAKDGLSNINLCGTCDFFVGSNSMAADRSFDDS